MTPDATYSLTDRYQAAGGEVLITGIQALVRLPIDLLRADRRPGWTPRRSSPAIRVRPSAATTGSCRANASCSTSCNIVHVPGLNEELAATSVFGIADGSNFRPRRSTKASPVSGTASRRASIAPATRSVMAASAAPVARAASCCWSATMPRRSRRPFRRAVDPTLVALHLPVLYPGTVQDVLDLGIHAFAHVAADRPVGGDEDHHARRRRLGHGRGRSRPVRPGAAGLRGRRQAVDADAQRPRRRPLRQHPGDRGARQPHRMGQALRRGNPLNRFVTNPSMPGWASSPAATTCEQVLEALRVLGLDRRRLGRARCARPEARCVAPARPWRHPRACQRDARR